MNEEGTVTCVVECPALGVDQTVCTKRKAGESVQAWQARHFENVAAITAACNL